MPGRLPDAGVHLRRPWRDPDSDVVKRKHSPLDYALLDDQHTHPRITYEALVRNPNPKIAETRA